MNGSTAARTAAPPAEAAVLHRHEFEAMAVQVECVVEAAERPSAAFAAVEAEFERLEQVFSRFRADSELSQLNGVGEGQVGADLYDVVALALDGRDRTGGRFDPTVLDAVVSAGYDRTFAALPADGPPPTARPCGGTVTLDPATRTVRLGAGTHLDLGGIAKGYAAERACERFAGIGPCLVNAGGDVAIAGVPRGGSWPVGVDVQGVELTLGLAHGGVATSGCDYRRWVRGGREQHHLIDPSTGLPSDSDLVSVTVVASDAVEAEIRAKALFLAGGRAAVAEADALGLPSVLVARDGRVVRAGGLA